MPIILKSFKERNYGYSTSKIITKQCWERNPTIDFSSSKNLCKPTFVLGHDFLQEFYVHIINENSC